MILTEGNTVTAINSVDDILKWEQDHAKLKASAILRLLKERDQGRTGGAGLQDPAPEETEAVMCQECRTEFVRLLQQRIQMILRDADPTEEDRVAARSFCFHLMELSIGLLQEEPKP